MNPFTRPYRRTTGMIPGAASLARELPYLYSGTYQQFGPVHLLDDGSFGYAVYVDVPCVESAPNAEAEISAVIAQCLRALDPGMQWQWTLSTRANIENQIALYQQQPGRDNIGRAFSKQFCQRWLQAQADGFFPNDRAINFHPRTLSILLALKSVPLQFHRPKLTRWFTAQDASGHPVNPSAQRFVAVVQDILAALDAAGIDYHPLDSEDLIAWVTHVLFPNRITPPGAMTPVTSSRQASPFHEIRDAIASAGHLEQINGRGFVSCSHQTSHHHRVVSMMWTPRAIESGLINQLVLQRPNLFVCLCAGVQSNSASLLQLKARALLNARSTHRFNAAEMQAREEALHEVEQRLFANGERIVELRLHLHLIESSADAAERSAALVAKWMQSMDIEARVESDIASALILRGELPFSVQAVTEHQLRRRRRMLSNDAADLHPAGASWRGITPPSGEHTATRPGPIVMYANACGEPLFIDPTKADKNPHALVVGQSGSGKSFFVHDYLLHLWRLPDVRLFLVSIKNDYRKLAIILGKYVEISLDNSLSLNPFGGKPGLENQLRWYTALVLMLTEGREASLSRETEIILQTCCLTAAQKNWDPLNNRPIQETCLEHICQELERWPGAVGRALSQQLHPYRRGPYRHLFNAPRSVHPSDRFIFFNLGNILRQPCAALASFCVFQIVDEVMNDPALRGVPKGLIADEVWALVRNPHAAAILERSLKAYRSLGGFAIPIVQDPRDLDTPSGRVMLINTATKIILPLDTVGQQDIRQYVQLNDREFAIVCKLRLIKRRYSEFFVSIDGHQSAKGILIPDPFRYAVSTTDPADEEQLERLYQRNGNMLDAVTCFARDTPFGVHHAH